MCDVVSDEMALNQIALLAGAVEYTDCISAEK